MSKKRKSKSKINYKNIALFGISIFLIVLVLFVGYKFLNDSSSEVKDEIIQEESATTPYSLRSNATDYQKEIYKLLENSYKNDKNSLETAELIAMNFVADFYTLSNKTIKNDIGGAQFWYPDYRLNFRDSAINSYYFNLETMIDDLGSENLPTVMSVEVVSSVQDKTDYECEIVLEWTYANHSLKDDIPSSATINILKYDTGLFMSVLK